VKALLEEEVEDEVVLEAGWDQGTGSPLLLMQVTTSGSLLSV
jgi:predicted nucleotidyltransferase